jgi:multiple sugar transport system permease protein
MATTTTDQRLKDQRRAGWIFVAPALAILLVFLVAPIFMALYVSFTNWRGLGTPLGGNADLVGLDNYRALLLDPGLARNDFAVSLRNTMYYVLFVVPLQTVLALTLALVVSQRFLRGRSFFRTAFYFPSVTSSIAISVVFLFLFQSVGVVNSVLAWFGIQGPNWFADPRGIFHVALTNLGLVDPTNPPTWLVENSFWALSLWEWVSGPSVAMMTIIFLVTWTSAGTYMLMFIASLQDISFSIDEASMVDGAGTWQRLRYITLPMLRPTLFLVITLGLIGTWQVFDQVYVMSQGAPGKTTLTPAFQSYVTSFRDFQYGPGAAMAFLLFGIIILMTMIQRFIMRDKDAIAEKKALKRQQAQRRAQVSVGSGGAGTGSGTGVQA